MMRIPADTRNNSTMTQWRGLIGSPQQCHFLKSNCAASFVWVCRFVFFVEVRLRDDNVLTGQTHISGSCVGRQCRCCMPFSSLTPSQPEISVNLRINGGSTRPIKIHVSHWARGTAPGSHKLLRAECINISIPGWELVIRQCLQDTIDTFVAAALPNFQQMECSFCFLPFCTQLHTLFSLDFLCNNFTLLNCFLVLGS